MQCCVSWVHVIMSCVAMRIHQLGIMGGPSLGGRPLISRILGITLTNPLLIQWFDPQNWIQKSKLVFGISTTTSMMTSLQHPLLSWTSYPNGNLCRDDSISLIYKELWISIMYCKEDKAVMKENREEMMPNQLYGKQWQQETPSIKP